MKAIRTALLRRDGSENTLRFYLLSRVTNNWNAEELKSEYQYPSTIIPMKENSIVLEKKNKWYSAETYWCRWSSASCK